MRRRDTLASASVLVLALSFAGISSAMAQEGTAAASEPEAAANISDIIVTAQRRSQRLQDVPLSVSALGAEQLEARRIQSIEDFQGSVPTLVYSEHNASDPQVRIRGIGSDFDGASLERSVAIFVDDVYLGRASGGTADLFDLDRVEVLRGPQGTLYGKNTVGGALNFISARPTQTPLARLSATIGNYNTLEARAVVSGPLTDAVAGRFSFATRNHDGYNINLNTGNDVDDLSSVALRGALDIDVSDTVNLVLSADSYRRRGAGANRHAINIGNPAFAAAAGPDARHNYLVDDGRQDTDTSGVSARLVWDSPIGTVTSITAYRTNDADIALDLGGNRFSRVPGEITAPFGNSNSIQEAAEQYSQELRLGNTIGDFSYVAGLYLFHEKVERREETVIFAAASPINQVNIQEADSSATSYAVFLDGTYRFNDQWELGAGLRWSKDDKSYAAVISGNRFPGLPWTVDEEKSWDAFTPRVTLSYHATPNHMIYGTVSRGFKSGGWDGQPTSLAAAGVATDPEYVTNYEIGAKTAWLDRRLILNGSIFYMDYTDLQIFTLMALPGQLVPVGVLMNAGSAVNAGLELEANFALSDRTNISLAYGFLDTEITNDVMVGSINVNGNRFTRSPEHTLSLNVDQTVPLSSEFDLSLHGSYRYTSDFYYNMENTAPGLMPATNILDGSVELIALNADWKVSLWGKNLTDEEYPTHIIVSANTGFARFAPPRTFGATLTWTY